MAAVRYWYGRPFEVHSSATVLPATAAGIHCYLPAPNLIPDAAQILEVPAELISPCLDEVAAAEGWSARRCPPGPRPHRRSPPSTCRPSIRPNGPWLTPCSACTPRGLTGWPGSLAWES